MKKVLLFILMFLPIVVIARDTYYVSYTYVDGLYYSFNSDTKTATLTCKGISFDEEYGDIEESTSANYSGSIEIPSEVTYNNVTYKVTSIGERACWFCSNLTSVTIPNSVTSISAQAFEGSAWYNNQPEGLVYAGKVVYKYKGEMPPNTHITLKEGTLGIAEEAFSGCSGLASITIPNSVISIGKQAFSGCRNLTSVTIPNSVTSIGKRTFAGCRNLTSVTIPNSVISIGKLAFEGCRALTSLYIPNSVNSIGASAFYGCI